MSDDVGLRILILDGTEEPFLITGPDGAMVVGVTQAVKAADIVIDANGRLIKDRFANTVIKRL